MSGTQLHLAISHVPVVGSFFVLGLLLAATRWRSPSLWRAGLVSALLMALCASAAMTSGPVAQDEVRASLDPTGLELVRLHEVAGQLVTAALALLAVLSLHAWLVLGPQGPRARWITPALLFTALLAAGSGVWAAGVGGRIRHLELRTPPATPVPEVDAPASTTPFTESSLDSAAGDTAGSP